VPLAVLKIRRSRGFQEVILECKDASVLVFYHATSEPTRKNPGTIFGRRGRNPRKFELRFEV